MKKIYLALLTTLILASCGEKKEQSLDDVIATKNLKEIRNKKSELDKQLADIS